MGAPAPDCRLRLMAITSRRLAGGTDELIRVCGELCEAGLPSLMLREKDLDGAALYRLAIALREITRRTQTLLIVNDRMDVAMAAHADGVHLGRTAPPPEVLRPLKPAPFLIGVSCHDRHELEHAMSAGADYATLSPVFPPKSKRSHLAPLGIDGFAGAVSGCCLPVLALGGITAQAASELRTAGAAGIAVIGALIGADSPCGALKELQTRWER